MLAYVRSELRQALGVRTLGRKALLGGWVRVSEHSARSKFSRDRHTSSSRHSQGVHQSGSVTRNVGEHDDATDGTAVMAFSGLLREVQSVDV